VDAKVMKETLLDAIGDEWDDGGRHFMSQIGQCPRKVYHDLVNGHQRPSNQGRRYCHEGYLHEADVIERLEGTGVPVLNQGRELVAEFDERCIGHIDGEVDGDLLEIKSCTRAAFDQVRWRGAKPRHEEQVQLYLRYGDYARGLIVYKCRDTGEIWVVEVLRDDEVGKMLEERAKAILRAVDRGKAPGCTCGRCKG
jgi:hypothetical protein